MQRYLASNSCVSVTAPSALILRFCRSSNLFIVVLGIIPKETPSLGRRLAIWKSLSSKLLPTWKKEIVAQNIKPLSFFTLRVKIWVKKNIKEILCNILEVDVTIFKKIFLFAHKKLPSKFAQKYYVFFPFLPWAAQTEEFMFQNVA